MKRICMILTLLAVIFTAAACGSGTEGETTAAPAFNTPPSQVTEEPDEESTQGPSVQTNDEVSQGGDATSPAPDSDTSSPDIGTKSLIVYFSWSGNTEKVASSIQSQTGADIFELVPTTPYSDNYNTVLDVARDEQSRDARPAISGEIPDFDSYDVVYVGFPNWWGDMPMILYTFFDSYDLSGKTIAPFCTSGGSGFSGTISTMKALEEQAVFVDGLHLGSSASSSPDSAVGRWLGEISLA